MSDALDRLKQRQRPKVVPRDASLTSRSRDMPMSRHIEGEGMEDEAGIAEVSEIGESRHKDVQTPNPPEAGRGVEVSRHIDIPMSASSDNGSMIKRSTFRLDADLIERLHTFCRQQGLSREVLIEAMYEYMEANPEALAQVAENAGQKHDHRQQLANRKRAEAMMSKFGRDI